MLLAFKHQGTKVEFTVALKFNQGTLRHRGVIDGGALLGSFLGKQKGTSKKLIKRYNKITYAINGVIAQQVL